MKIKQAILSCMGREELKRAVDDLGVDGVDRRSVEDMAVRLGRARRATPEALLGYLSEAQVKDVCEQVGVSARGRRAALVAALLDGQDEQPLVARLRQHDDDGETNWSKPGEARMNEERTATVTELIDPAVKSGFQIARTELVWPGKYDEHGNLNEPRRVSLPFQVIEVIEEGRTSKEALAQGLLPLFGEKPRGSAEDGWRSKLIWGDNLLVESSLLAEFAGKIDLIYIDPPFATGSDFSFIAEVGEEGVDAMREPTLIETKAYRDTWGRGLDSYLEMIWKRLRIMRELLSDTGSIFVHLDETVGSHVKLILDELLGAECFINSITWKRSDAHSDIGQGAKHLGKICDTILYFSRRSGDQTLNMEFNPLPESTADRWYRHVEEGTGRRYNKADMTGPGGARKGNPVFEWKGVTRAWRFSKQSMVELDKKGRIVYSSSGMPYLKRYLDESKGVPLQDLWDDIKMIRGIHANSEFLGYKTQKPESLLKRIISLASNPGDLVADFFSGSGTTLAVAEKLGRRWIGCDLGRFAIHTTRKRLLELSTRPRTIP